jgi:hypothetical protein
MLTDVAAAAGARGARGDGVVSAAESIHRQPARWRREGRVHSAVQETGE